MDGDNGGGGTATDGTATNGTPVWRSAHPPLDPSRLFARLGHYYPWFSDDVGRRMPWPRVLMYAREMAIALQEQQDAEDAEAERVRREIDARTRRQGASGASAGRAGAASGAYDEYGAYDGDPGSGAGGGVGGGGVTTGPWDDLYAAAHPDEEAQAATAPRGGMRSGGGIVKPVAWQWDD